jgi:hypothetical protein
MALLVPAEAVGAAGFKMEMLVHSLGMGGGQKRTLLEVATMAVRDFFAGVSLASMGSSSASSSSSLGRLELPAALSLKEAPLPIWDSAC